MPPLPPLNLDFGSSAVTPFNMAGASWGGFGAGAWNVNVAGSGQSSQSATSSASMMPYLIAAAAVVFALLKK